MRSSKIKNIIILMLLLVNAALLALVGARSWRSRQAQRETGERMAAVLEQNGVEFLPPEVPGALDLVPRRVRVLPLEEAGAQTLLGKVARAEAGRSRTVFTGDNGTVTTTAGGDVEAVFPLDAGLDEAAGLVMLEALGVEMEERERLSEAGVTTVRGCRLWEGVPVPEAEVVLTLQGEALTGLRFRHLAAEEEPAAAGETITAATALARFLEELNQGGYVCSQVREIYPGYAVSGATVLTLTPTWYVETDAWPWRFAVDGVTGEVTAADDR